MYTNKGYFASLTQSLKHKTSHCKSSKFVFQRCEHSNVVISVHPTRIHFFFRKFHQHPWRQTRPKPRLEQNLILSQMMVAQLIKN